MKYQKKTRRVTCGPNECAIDVARQQWGDSVQVALSDQEREDLEQLGYRRVGAVSVRASQPDYAVMADWEEICYECGGRVYTVDCPAELREHPDAQSYCERCGQEWDPEGDKLHGVAHA